MYCGTLTSSAAYTSVKEIGRSNSDVLDYTTNPHQVALTITNNGTGTKDFNALPVDGATDCLNITTPEVTQIYYGPFRVPLNPPLELGTQSACPKRRQSPCRHRRPRGPPRDPDAGEYPGCQYGLRARRCVGQCSPLTAPGPSATRSRRFDRQSPGRRSGQRGAYRPAQPLQLFLGRLAIPGVAAGGGHVDKACTAHRIQIAHGRGHAEFQSLGLDVGQHRWRGCAIVTDQPIGSDQPHGHM